MQGKTIATIYFYVISAASLLLIVIGIFNAVNLGINFTQYDKYPLRYPQGNCEIYPYKYGPYPAMEVARPSTPSAKELAQSQKSCLAQEELERKQHKVEDIKNTVTFTLVGIILFSIHFPLARRQSK